jgi:hypothetical protein
MRGFIIEADIDFAINVPKPRLISMIPKEESILMASRTEFLPTPNCWANSDSMGNLSPGLSSFERRQLIKIFIMEEETGSRFKGITDLKILFFAIRKPFHQCGYSFLQEDLK